MVGGDWYVGLGVFDFFEVDYFEVENVDFFFVVGDLEIFFGQVVDCFIFGGDLNWYEDFDDVFGFVDMIMVLLS